MNVSGPAEMPGSEAANAAAASISRPWLKSYPAGVPPKIDEARIGTLVDFFRHGISAYADRPAVESFGKRMTYRELGQEAAKVTSWLQSRGIGKGDRVAIMLPNVMAYPAIMYGVLNAGATVVNINPLYTPRELIQQMRDSGARLLFVLENFATTVEAAGADIKVDQVVIVKPGDLLGLKGAIINLVSRYVKKAVKPFTLPGSVSLHEVMAKGAGTPPKPVPVSPDDIAFLQYTGGTTGVAKGAMLLHRNVAANVMQCEAWMVPYFGDRSDHVMVTALPLYHIFGLTACALADAEDRRLPIADHQSARHSGIRQNIEDATVHADVGRQHALQRPVARARHRGGGFFAPRLRDFGRHGHAGGGGEEVAGSRRHAHRRRIWPVRDIPGRVRQPTRHQGIHRNHRLSGPLHGHRCPRGRTARFCHSASAGNCA